MHIAVRNYIETFQERTMMPNMETNNQPTVTGAPRQALGRPPIYPFATMVIGQVYSIGLGMRGMRKHKATNSAYVSCAGFMKRHPGIIFERKFIENRILTITRIK